MTKHTGGGGSVKKPQSIYPKIAILKNAKVILKVQSESSKISNIGQIFVSTENCTPNYSHESF